MSGACSKCTALCSSVATLFCGTADDRLWWYLHDWPSKVLLSGCWGLWSCGQGIKRTQGDLGIWRQLTHSAGTARQAWTTDIFIHCAESPMLLPASESEPLISGSDVSVWGGNDRWSRVPPVAILAGSLLREIPSRWKDTAPSLIMYRLGACSVPFKRLSAASMIDSVYQWHLHMGAICCRS